MSKALDKYLDELYPQGKKETSAVDADKVLQRLKVAGVINDYKIKGFTKYENRKTSHFINIYIKATSKSEFQLV